MNIFQQNIESNISFGNSLFSKNQSTDTFYIPMESAPDNIDILEKITFLGILGLAFGVMAGFIYYRYHSEYISIPDASHNIGMGGIITESEAGPRGNTYCYQGFCYTQIPDL